MNAEEILDHLSDGNERFCDGKSTLTAKLAEQRLDTAQNGQHPHTVVLTCSDSRVVPELIFDQGIGELFVVRVAGNVAGESEVGSVEFAVKKLETPLLIVLGHDDCGAVTAACMSADVPENVQKILDRIHHPIRKVRAAYHDIDDLTEIERAIEANVDHVIEGLLEKSAVISDAVDQGKLLIVPAIYRIDSGKVVYLADQ